jgi:hypothetical protein
MKNSTHNPPIIVCNHLFDKEVGITLGTGACAEHDAKLEGFRAIMGLGRAENTPEAMVALEDNGFDPHHTVIGVEKHLITMPAAHLEEVDASGENPDETRLLLGDAVSNFYKHKNIAVDHSACENPFSSAWAALFNTGSAEIRAFTPEARQALRSVYNAILAGEALMAGRDYQVFGDRVVDVRKSAPLIVDRRGLLPEQREAVIAQDIEALRLQRLVDATGIPKALEEAGIKLHAFCADVESDGELSFFINPHNSEKYNSGRYSGEEILDMIDGTGPAVKETLNQSIRP